MPKTCDDFIPSAPPLTQLNYNEFKNQFIKCTFDYGYFKFNAQKRIDALQNTEELVLAYEETISVVSQLIPKNQERLTEIEQYGEDGLELKIRITNEIARQKKYIEEMRLKRAKILLLKWLFSLNSNALCEAMQKDKATFLVIIQTPNLIKQISYDQMQQLSIADGEILQALASYLGTKEYNLELNHVFSALKRQTQSPLDLEFIDSKQNEAISILLMSIKKYLDKKIDSAVAAKSRPWALGYFGSTYNCTKNEQKIAIPQGIYELKAQLNQVGTIPSSQILINVQSILRSKIEERSKTSFWHQIQHFMSYILGYHRTQETKDEYDYLNQLTLGSSL